jgi:hypothetical protein
MEVDRVGIKVFAADPASVWLKAFVPVFHAWIQKQIVEGHLLIDVHDYSHVHHGPGILLVAHEGNFSMDMADGRPGLFYYRKHPLDGSPEERFSRVLKTALQACSLLESEPGLPSKIRFRTDELLIVANDRLQAPNEDKTCVEFQPVVSNVLRDLLGSPLELSQAGLNPKERFSMRVRVERSPGLKDILSRLSSPRIGYVATGL